MPFYTADYATHAEEVRKPLKTIDPTDPDAHKKARSWLAARKDRVSRPMTPVVLGPARVQRPSKHTAVLPGGLRLRAPTEEALLQALKNHGYYPDFAALEEAIFRSVNAKRKNRHPEKKSA